MERRVLLAVVLSFLVLYLYQSLLVPPPAPRTTPVETVAPAAPSAPESTGADASPEAAPAADESPAPPSTPAADPVEPLVGETAEREIVLETPDVRAVLSNRGAIVTSWQLKHYANAAGGAVDLVPSRVPLGDAGFFSVQVPDAAVTERLRGALFLGREDAPASGESAAVIFEYRDESGLEARKRLAIGDRSNPYIVIVEASVRLHGDELPVRWDSGPGLGDQDRPQGSGFFVGGFNQPSQGIMFRDGDVSRLEVDDLMATPQYEGRFGYVGIDDQYFLHVALPGEQRLEVAYVPFAGDAQAGRPQLVAYSARAEGSGPVRFFVGPKEFDLLAATDRDLVRVINFGIFSFLVVPLLRALKWVNGFVGNYGWSIIILTVLINAAMFPLRHKSVVSMRKMQQIQPEVKAIQERYANLKATDPAKQKMSQELWALYRERGVNPASGCLPMLLTLPVLFAFYSLLSQAIEIRGAPFIGWITDLTAYDPYYVTPLLMGATMVYQQRLTPSTADPTQQKVMMFMPIIFTFMFLWVPSGLVLYWLVSNVWAVGQQLITNRLSGPVAGRVVRPPAERRIKRAGRGRTSQAQSD